MIALEVLLRVSAKGNGLGNVSLDGYLKYTWTLLPTLIMAVIGLLFSMVDSTARTLHPFRLLRKGRAKLADILSDPARQVSVIAALRAAWNHHFALLWAILPALFAPILTIICSGLYSVSPVPWQYDTELQLEDRFCPENRTLVGGTTVEGDNFQAWTVFNLIQFSNMSYPDWTHGQYALSRFGTDNLRSQNGNDTSLHVTAQVPATRVNLNCSLAGHYTGSSYQNIKVTIDESQWLSVDPHPLGCDTPSEWNRTWVRRNLYLSSSGSGNLDGYLREHETYYLALLFDNYADLVEKRHNQIVQPTQSIQVCGDGRQHYFIGLGYGTETLALLHCVPYVESLWVTATFALPHLSLAVDVPVAPDTESAIFLSDSPSMTAFTSGYWDRIVAGLVNGSSGVGQLMGLMPGPDNDDASRLIAAVEGILSEYLAQNLHFNYRGLMDGNDSGTISTSCRDPLTSHGHPATATVTDETRLRLIQSVVSTRILQGLLGLMSLCLVAESASGRGARIIPRDPGSVASRMGYFAGGRVWRNVPVGADRWGDEEFRMKGHEIFQRRLLLGWWEGDDQESPEGGTRLTVARARRFAVDSVG